MTYYLVPFALLNNEFGIFFFAMNSILIVICVGMSLVSVLITYKLQKGILGLLLCCRKKDNVLRTIIEKRLETSQVHNTKIALTVTASIAFIIL